MQLIMTSKKLGTDFYRQPDVVQVSRELLGKVLCTQIGDAPPTSGIIVETEAYCGRDDKACHANDGLRTKRTEVMYQAGGVAYVYLCYGIHHLFNVVTNARDRADAVLVRAIKPADGIEAMLARRGFDTLSPKLTAGPGRLTQALGIKRAMSGAELSGPDIWIEDRQHPVANTEISCGPRIGVDYAGEHAKRPWRFFLKENRWVSK
jgi:DNA-3-methyladenine glycosylase